MRMRVGRRISFPIRISTLNGLGHRRNLKWSQERPLDRKKKEDWGKSPPFSPLLPKPSRCTATALLSSSCFSQGLCVRFFRGSRFIFESLPRRFPGFFVLLSCCGSGFLVSSSRWFSCFLVQLWHILCSPFFLLVKTIRKGARWILLGSPAQYSIELTN